MLCVPILADDPADAKRDAILAAEKGADIVEFRVDLLMEADLPLEARIGQIKELVAGSALPCIVTCRPEWEGGLYAGDEDERVSMFEALGTADSPPAYIDVELKAYTASANIRQKINLAVDHPKQERHVRTRLILSSHDFQGRPADLTRKILAMQAEPACAVVKVAYRARSIRDNLEFFDILSERQKPTIALGMGEFGLMSRVLAPKFGGFLTFASLRDESATAPGQPTIDDLLGIYRFRSIGKDTRVYGVIGWPVTQSMSPLIHNAGFAQIGWDGVYVPMPVEGSYESFKATMLALLDAGSLDFSGASVTIPHKENLTNLYTERFGSSLGPWLSHNTIVHRTHDAPWLIENTDQYAIHDLCATEFTKGQGVGIVGAGGVAAIAAQVAAMHRMDVHVFNRSDDKAIAIAEKVRSRRFVAVPIDRSTQEILDGNKCGPQIAGYKSSGTPSEFKATITAHTLSELPSSALRLYINCTPVGMAGGPDPDGLSIPIPDMPALPPETVFFDTVYNPIETPMLKAAKERGYRTIDGVQMFVRQAAAQFELWTGQTAPVELFDRLVRERLGGG